ncbi:hypothetical protein L9F63_023773, partial [Diploptera punctata]
MSELQTEIPSWLNIEFLENVLKHEDLEGDLKVTSFDIERATSAGDNYMSTIYRATVHTTKRGNSESKSLIIKCQPQEVLQK